MKKNHIKSTTIIGIRKGSLVVIAGDGQASFGNTVMKANVKKIRRLGSENSIISGFAGSTADAFALFFRFVVAAVLAFASVSVFAVAFDLAVAFGWMTQDPPP